MLEMNDESNSMKHGIKRHRERKTNMSLILTKQRLLSP